MRMIDKLAEGSNTIYVGAGRPSEPLVLGEQLPLTGKRILVVEQEKQKSPSDQEAKRLFDAIPKTTDLIKQRLMHHGARMENVVWSTSSKDAIDQLKKGTFDLLLLDGILKSHGIGTEESSDLVVDDSGVEVAAYLAKYPEKAKGLKIIITASEVHPLRHDQNSGIREQLNKASGKLGKEPSALFVNVPKSDPHWYDTGMDKGIQELFQ